MGNLKGVCVWVEGENPINTGVSICPLSPPPPRFSVETPSPYRQTVPAWFSQLDIAVSECRDRGGGGELQSALAAFAPSGACFSHRAPIENRSISEGPFSPAHLWLHGPVKMNGKRTLIFL